MTPPAPAPTTTGQSEIMSTYVVERYWPGVTPEILAAALERAKAAAEQLRPSGLVVHHLQSTLVPNEELVFCLFEATSSEGVEIVNRKADVPFDHVAQAVLVTSSPILVNGSQPGPHAASRAGDRQST